MKEKNRLQVSKLLEGADLLKGVPATVIQSLTDRVRHKHFKAGEVVFAKDATNTPVYYVVDGRVRITTIRHEGNELLIGLFDTGDVFGELALVDDGPRAVNAIADRDSYILEIDRRDLLPVVESNSSSAMALSRMLSVHIREAVTNLENLGFHDAQTRLWFKLMYLSESYGTVDSETGRLRIQHGLSQQNLADSIGMTRVMVNRQLSVWRKKKLIETGRGIVDVPDPAALESYVRNDPKSRDTDPI